MAINDDHSLGEAREWLINQIDKHDTERCPCCRKLNEKYHRQLYPAPVAGLVVAHEWYGINKWFHWPDTMREANRRYGYKLPAGGDGAKLEFWDLMERGTRNRDPDTPGAGWWRITAKGSAFVRNTITLPKCARVIGVNSQFTGWCDTKHPGETFCRDVVESKNKFSYAKLRGWE
jgi:hypothetical protein